MWHVTGDRWHVTGDLWHGTHSVGWTFSQNFSTLALPVWDINCKKRSINIKHPFKFWGLVWPHKEGLSNVGARWWNVDVQYVWMFQKLTQGHFVSWVGTGPYILLD